MGYMMSSDLIQNIKQVSVLFLKDTCQLYHNLRNNLGLIEIF